MMNKAFPSNTVFDSTMVKNDSDIGILQRFSPAQFVEIKQVDGYHYIYNKDTLADLVIQYK